MILLDTCVLLWLAGDPKSLSSAARTRISSARGRIFVSAITAFEIGVKHRKGLLGLPRPPHEWYSLAMKFHGLTELPVSGDFALRATALPLLHSDPCDRIIVATAQARHLTVLTPDPKIHAYPEVHCFW